MLTLVASIQVSALCPLSKMVLHIALKNILGRNGINYRRVSIVSKSGHKNIEVAELIMCTTKLLNSLNELMLSGMDCQEKPTKLQMLGCFTSVMEIFQLGLKLGEP